MVDDAADDLGFRTDFAGGNGLVSFRVSLGDGPTVVELSAICGGGERGGGGSVPLWFHTKISGLGREFIHLRLANAAQMNGDPAGWAGNTIVIRDGEDVWRRSPLPIVEDDSAGVMRVAYPLRIRSDRFEVAWCYPYQHDDLRRTVRDSRLWEAARIGRSAAGRVIERYRLGSNTSSASHDRDKRASVYVIGGQCAGETSASWVLDGLMRSAALDQGARSQGNNGLDWWVVPCVDVDGRDEGRYGRGLFGGEFDLSWSDDPGRTEVRALMIDMERWSLASQPCLVINLQGTAHADRSTRLINHGGVNGSGLNNQGGVDVGGLMERFTSGVETLTAVGGDYPDRDVDEVGGLCLRRADSPSFWGSWVGRRMGVPALTLAVSMQGSPEKDFEIEDYRRIGHALYGAVRSVL